jgi:F-box protein 18 (helicase)
VDKLTEEQERVVACNDAIIAVSAFAGAGKTSTLRAFAQSRSDKRILLMAFNRDIVQEMRGTMPSNVHVATSHAVAYGAVAKNWPKDKLQHGLSPKVIQEAGISKTIEQARHVKDVIDLFCTSNINDIDSFARAYFFHHVDEMEIAGLEEDLLVQSVQRLWRLLVDPSAPLGLHDVYFKLWQMSRPKLDYDIVMVDEAQDTNDALLDVLSAQRHAQRIFVGDPHQNIYGFRGAKNIMTKIREHHAKLYLTHSFRFGPPIAHAASALLRTFKAEEKQVVGAAAHTSSLRSPGQHEPPSSMSTAMLFRTNAGLFDAAAQMCSRGTVRINLLGGIEKTPLQDIEDAYYLYSRAFGQIKSPFMRRFAHFEQLCEYADKIDDREIKVRCKIVQKYRHAIPALVRKIAESHDPTARLTLVTAHRSKGAQWDQVILGEDYPELMHNGAPASQHHAPSGGEYNGAVLQNGEANLWYVAVTRARRSLTMNTFLQDFLGWHQKQYPVDLAAQSLVV